MKILITGFTGFVGQHFLYYLNTKEPGSVVLGIDKNSANFNFSNYTNIFVSFEAIDLLNKEATEKVINSFSPDYILHFASVSSVAQSWQSPQDSFVNNTSIFLNLVESIRLTDKKCRILSIGSSEEFGEVEEKDLPLTEQHPLKPLSPYAVARVSQEMLSKIYADGYSMDIVMTRSFNHIGPGQRDAFVVSSFAKQLVQLAKNGNEKKKIITGNLSIIRDFVDVRDVVKAYYLLLKEGKKGEIYNICSGKGFLLKDVIKIMGKLLNIEVETETNPSLERPNENKKIIGSYEKIRAEIGWKPEIEIEESLSDIIDYWKQQTL